ncbi:DUF4124 domain-containing protein [Pseudomonas sp. AN-1]|uniref:DUF4124 domain-containing protein n=1 Tax=Pseudomonas sp. AN-1 TaxID=3096605 RepID=UPI002A6B5E7D|nr:DUF4124 domain-containing protein [Pseudomonas sp. AN-1]WPP45131.1 DUF4124 domain-containing protein [Pseudomonas sp. AN-1]
MRALLCLLLLTSLPAFAGVYTYLDADGNRVFTDKPRSANAQRVELAPANSASLPAPPPAAPPALPAALLPAYQLLRITLPEPDATIRDNDGNLLVTLESDPGLLAGHRYRLLLDGRVHGAPARSPVFTLDNLDRGTHQLAAEIVDAEGRIVERTPSQPFHLRRTTLADKRRVNPCQKGDYGVRPECPLADKPAEPRRFLGVPLP